jgi:hypothetical protein
MTAGHVDGCGRKPVPKAEYLKNNINILKAYKRG